jgi:hypothetical protein
MEANMRLREIKGDQGRPREHLAVFRHFDFTV